MEIHRGARTVEVLKQGQYLPMAMETQVIILYAVTNGFMDDVSVAGIREWERGFLEYAQAQFPQIGDKIKSDKIISKETEEALKRAKEWPGLLGADYVKEVTHKEAFTWDAKDEQSAAFDWPA